MEEKPAYPEGIGDLLADRVKETSHKYADTEIQTSKGSEEFALHMKGQNAVRPH